MVMKLRKMKGFCANRATSWEKTRKNIIGREYAMLLISIESKRLVENFTFPKKGQHIGKHLSE